MVIPQSSCEKFAIARSANRSMTYIIAEEHSAESKAFVKERMYAYNASHFPEELKARYREVNLLLKDGEGHIFGGLIGEICWNWLEIHYLYVEEADRKHGYGTLLMQEAERLARAGECDFIKLDTLGFQALDFYRKLEFEVYGSIDNAGGYTHYYMKKELCDSEGVKYRMNLTIDVSGESKVANLSGDGVVIENVQDALDALMNAHYLDCDKLLIRKELINEDFFELKTGLAGEILQKCTNYRTKLAVAGDFSGYNSKSLNDFIYECNHGNSFFFKATEEEALKTLHGVA